LKAVVYQEPYKVTVEQMPKIEAPNDAVVRMTTNICGSDLHMCQGRIPAG
jgi:threonine dehydrogenase-like Zn-dependent dehydrogenase